MRPTEIRYVSDTSGVCWQRISDLFEAVGWEKSHPEDLEQAFRKSTYVRVAYHQDKIVGVGRTVDDGKYYGMIVDLVVDPAYQGRGIDSTILQQLREEMAGFRIVSLRAARGKHDFYLKHGWKKSESAFHWPG
ncbi:MAG: GNAT family N-acetyltransferase [Candidatus Latescibacteria bacterium]|jgi:GNAT superfamily N-acetyltransferase|nr:GNAT family N-acetyltransferase [Candidatus Latescibacterota bacterium]